ncbi:RNA polymerase sigma factor [Streptomyces sp. NBC_00198]|uniref:RNA polymerase sigma factor n=1 Tax=Streptomyces sp. NBC_00198 TaxID=2975677 RepID=UPI00224F95DB|nr:sigma-70 family RNA polymerase sigma factor [Streptomyces sp. NBC_00198]MCX5285984.1 RNA polymerase sigma factor [Streptomyces sp. NBC_00198]MCX5286293.1 RNA polymerase sigma factor [Streptomyces sp. NBC_00198]
MITEANGATPSSDTREPALITLALAGDRDAFGELYALHHPAVLAFVDRRVRNRAIAEDITGETFLAAWSKLHTFTWRGTSIKGWLTTIARNRVIDHYKSSQRREFGVDDLLPFDDRLAPSTETVVLDRIDDQQLRVALSKLKAPQLEVLARRFLMQYSVAETAQAMDRSEGAVKTLQFRAVASLRTKLQMGVAA